VNATRPRSTPNRASAAALAPLLAVVALALGACGSSGSSSTNASSSSSSKAGGGKTVAVIYAGSLSKLMEDDIGPAFQKASGYAFEGFGGGSGEDAEQIKGRVRRLDVFVSASAEADEALEGAANGDWVSWYSTFATTSLVLGFDPASSYGRQLAAGKPWYDVLGEPGIRVGRTDPKLDPKGALTVAAVREASRTLKRPALEAALRSFPVFPETALVGRLQSGQLDAGFLYAIEAHVANIPTVGLDPVEKTAAYTVTILNRAPDRAGAEAFVDYLLRASTASALTAGGLQPIAPAKLSGRASAVPAGVAAAVG
jgi:molybdate/tungstate transport system substrate-binding protein